ncbi:Helix-turn-helix domain-containing protein [Alkalispirochaeta americana]|uniref:Helix-turn-helix domain-containing protein n=1 Tax=Alkalispirochaeta americana TaxID=159291 RepID=A0A1N6Q9H4_9SPIO|nr:response regulator [Alkalispirochaeta americana]SIQ13227.1 Helix-turn-helix domain-containing protein [Alkalispirochaeta americana]
MREEKTVLLVDDEPLALDRLRGAFSWEEAGFSRILLACDGAEALRCCREETISLVVTDVVMPRLDGLSLVETLRREEYQGEVIVLTGHDDFSFARRALRSRVRDYVLKPVDSEELLRAVREVVMSQKRKDPSERLWFTPSPLIQGERVLCVAVQGFGLFPDSPSLLSREVLLWVEKVLFPGLPVKEVLLGQECDAAGVVLFFRGQTIEYSSITALLNPAEDLRQGLCAGVVLGEVETEDFDRSAAQIWATLAKERALTRRFFPDAPLEQSCSAEAVGSAGAVEPDMIRGIQVQIFAALMQRDAHLVGEFLEKLFTLLGERLPSYRVLEHVLADLFLYVFAYDTRGRDRVLPREVAEILGNSRDLEDARCQLVQRLTGEFSRLSSPCSPALRHVDAARQVMEERFADSRLSLNEIAQGAAANPSYLSTLFKQQTGQSVTEYLTARRLEHALTVMREGASDLGEVASACGYQDPYYFSRCFKRHYGEAPSVVLRRFRQKTK